jgi:hypothetical protein
MMESREALFSVSFVNLVRNLSCFKSNMMGDAGSHKVHKVHEVHKVRDDSTP